MVKLKFRDCVFSTFLGSLAVCCSIRSAEAAESVIINYGILQQSVSVSELSDLARNGEATRSLNRYLKRVNREPNDLQEILTKKIKIDPIVLSKTLNSLPGEMLLEGVSEVIRTPSRRASRQSLRAAIVGSALSDGEIQLIEVIENYPTQQVYVEGDRLVQIYKQLDRVLRYVPKFLFN